MVTNWTAEGLEKGNMANQFLDELDQLVSRWKASTPTCEQSSCSPLETSRKQEGPSGGRLDVKQCSCGVLDCFPGLGSNANTHILNRNLVVPWCRDLSSYAAVNPRRRYPALDPVRHRRKDFTITTAWQGIAKPTPDTTPLAIRQPSRGQ